MQTSLKVFRGCFEVMMGGKNKAIKDMPSFGNLACLYEHPLEFMHHFLVTFFYYLYANYSYDQPGPQPQELHYAPV
jgi:hypothetical protein